MHDLDTGQGDVEDDQIDLVFAQGSHQQLLQLEEENSRTVLEREKKVNEIVKSISDLNKIFKDLAYMVSEQVNNNKIIFSKNSEFPFVSLSQ